MYKLRCKECKQYMMLEDTDYNFKGNQDDYYYCGECHISAVAKIRYGRIVKVLWNDDIYQ